MIDVSAYRNNGLDWGNPLGLAVICDKALGIEQLLMQTSVVVANTQLRTWRLSTYEKADQEVTRKEHMEILSALRKVPPLSTAKHLLDGRLFSYKKRSGEENREEKLKRRRVKGRRKSLPWGRSTRKPYCHLQTVKKGDKRPISEVFVAYGH